MGISSTEFNNCFAKNNSSNHSTISTFILIHILPNSSNKISLFIISKSCTNKFKSFKSNHTIHCFLQSPPAALGGQETQGSSTLQQSIRFHTHQLVMSHTLFSCLCCVVCPTPLLDCSHDVDNPRIFIRRGDSTSDIGADLLRAFERLNNWLSFCHTK